ncbi:unnamed protein product, partial [Rotaria socialis]
LALPIYSNLCHVALQSLNLDEGSPNKMNTAFDQSIEQHLDESESATITTTTTPTPTSTIATPTKKASA